VAAGAESPPTSERKTRLSNAHRIALDALEEAIAKSGTVPPASNQIPANTKTVTLSLWRRFVYQRDPDESKEAEARRKSFQRARQSLQKHGCVGVWGSEDGNAETAMCWLIR
jgi:hypothetical protein